MVGRTKAASSQIQALFGCFDRWQGWLSKYNMYSWRFVHPCGSVEGGNY